MIFSHRDVLSENMTDVPAVMMNKRTSSCSITVLKNKLFRSNSVKAGDNAATGPTQEGNFF